MVDIAQQFQAYLDSFGRLLREAVRGEPRRRWGDALDFTQAKALDLVKQDNLRFDGVINAGGTIKTQPATINGLPSDSIYEIVSYSGDCTNPATVAKYAGCIQFNLSLTQGATNFFTANQSFGPLINVQGSTGQQKYNGGVRYIPAGQGITCTLSTYAYDSGTIDYSTKINEEDGFGLTFYCNVYRLPTRIAQQL